MGTVLVSFLWVDRDSRQRRDIDEEHVKDVANSFLRLGQLTPILYKPTGELIFGEHRWEAAKLLGWTSMRGDLEESEDPDLHQAMELEENVKRLDLSWQDKALAIKRYHDQRFKVEQDWTQEKTAEALGFDSAVISRNIAVGKELENGNDKISIATSLNAGYNILARRESRERDSEAVRAIQVERLAIELTDADINPEPQRGTVQTTSLPARSTPSLPAVIQPDLIQVGDFLTWAPSYTGDKFNFLHCDFPYGVNIDKSDQANAETRGAYADTPETYWTLLECLAENWDRLMLPSSHFMFWFSMDFYAETIEFLAKKVPALDVDVFPLYWLKSDGKGILPDPSRGPRRIVETCLFGRSGDRKIVQATHNGYACPTYKNQALHLSEKPEPMLRHFFKMIVDENTAMLDPTCGGGSSLRAADSLKASRLLGIELNPEYAETANVALKRSQLLRRTTGI